MTRRIALSILLTVWLMLLAGGLTAYLTTRSVLLEELDAAILARAAALPELRAPGADPSTSPPLLQPGDRYLIRNSVGQTIARPTDAPAATPPVIVGESFARLADGSRVRSLTLRVDTETGSPLTITYSASAASFDRLLARLAFTLSIFGIAGGLVAAAIAVKVSRRALRPLHRTADTIGAIDESRLDRRIAPADLPPELRPMAERLNEMLARLDTAFRRRRQFLADASHELRTPVAALMTAIEVSLRRPRDADAYRATLHACLSDATLLRSLVERLMEHARSERLDHDEPPEPIDLPQLLNECADLVAPLALEKNVRLERDLPDSLPLTTQPGRLRSIVINLLSNAIEYTHPNTPVRLACTRTPTHLTITVEDHGPGIAPEHLPHLFEPFYRADRARQRAKGHLGLGLFLVQSHAHALAGQCTVTSTLNHGTTFTITLPAPSPARTPLTPTPALG